MTLKISVDEIASIRVVNPQLTTRFVSKRDYDIGTLLKVNLVKSSQKHYFDSICQLTSVEICGKVINCMQNKFCICFGSSPVPFTNEYDIGRNVV